MAGLIGRTIGLYQIVEEIGQGSMATVYRAYRPLLDRYVAVKVLAEELSHNAAAIERFQREARTASLLRHPNIIRVYDIGRDGDLYFVAMDHVAGPSLAQRLKQHGPLSPEAALNILRQVGAALDYAHAEGVLHRDVSPASVLLGSDGQAILSDFGVDVAGGEPWRTQTGLTVGTPEYVPPEQIRGEGLDGRSDLYSLGAVLYEMLTGQAPFRAATPAEVLSKQLGEAPPAASLVNPAIPRAVDRVILRALSKQKARRYGTAREMVRAFAWAAGLEDQLAAEPDHTPPPRAAISHPAAAGRWGGRRLLLLGVGAALALALLGALAGPHLIAPAPTPTAAPVAALPTATPAPTATPSPTVTPSPTAPEPTATATPLSSATPPPTATRVPTRARATSGPPSSTPSPTLAPAPILEAPIAGAGVGGRVTFRWRWARPLQANEYYDLRVWLQGQPHFGIAWTRETSYQAALAQGGSYQWGVAVIQYIGMRPDGTKEWHTVSEESASWPLNYSRGSSGTGGTAKPTEPPPQP